MASNSPPTTSDPDPSKTLTTQKQIFLTRQIRLLSTPLLPISSPSTTNADITQQTLPLPQTLQTTLLTKINKKITSHNRLSFSLESQQHIREQIEGVYWRDVLSGGLPVGRAETVVERDVDFTRGEVVRGVLPGDWEGVVVVKRGREEDDVGVDGRNDLLSNDDENGERPRKRRKQSTRLATNDTSPEEQQQREQDTPQRGNTNNNTTISNATSTFQRNPTSSHSSRSTRYTTLLTSLTARLSTRDSLLRKLNALKHLKATLIPFEDAAQNIQGNLVHKENKELQGEIARMRVLLVKVGNRVALEKEKEATDRLGQEAERRKSIDVEAGTGADTERESILSERQRLGVVLGLG